MPPKSLAKTILIRLMLITLALLALHVVFQWLNLHYDQKQGQIYEISNRVDMDDEVALPTWFSQFLLLAIAAAAFIAARFDYGARRKAWLAIATAGLLFSIDEVGSIHEFVLQSAHLIYYGEAIPTAALNAWWIMLPFIGGVGLCFAWWLWRALPIRTVKLLIAAGIVYLAGAAGFELFSNDFNKATFMYQGVMTGAEEVLEMLGCSLAIYAIVDYLQINHRSKLDNLRKALGNKR